MTNHLADTSLEIIPCSIKDLEALSEVAIRSYKDFYLYLWYDTGEWYIDRSFAPSVLEAELRDPNQIFFFLKNKQDLVGFLKLNVDQPLKNYEAYNCIELERIYFIRSAVGKGFGRRAVEFCFEYAANLGKEIVWLKAMDSSDAIFFYEKLGFERCGAFRLNFPQMKPEFRGMVIMMKEL